MRMDFLPKSYSFGIEKDALNEIIIEQAELFEQLTMALKKGIDHGEEATRLWEGGNLIPMQKNCDVIFSPYDVSVGRKELQKKALELFLLEVHHTIDDELSEVNQRVLRIVEDIAILFDFELTFSSDITAEDVIKVLGVKLKEIEGSFVERVSEYIRYVHRLASRSIFFLVNCRAYMEKEDCNILKRIAMQERISIVLIERGFCNKEGEVNGKINIIDNDLCELFV